MGTLATWGHSIGRYIPHSIWGRGECTRALQQPPCPAEVLCGSYQGLLPTHLLAEFKRRAVQEIYKTLYVPLSLSLSLSLYIQVYTYIPTQIHTYTNTYIHTYIHTLHTYIHTYTYPYMHSSMCVYSCVHLHKGDIVFDTLFDFSSFLLAA